MCKTFQIYFAFSIWKLEINLISFMCLLPMQKICSFKPANKLYKISNFHDLHLI
ncbi:hypothetical protein MHIR_DE00054 [Candidatus Doolittlea endobia]|uniref:Uncharacterized protein n=1 Tax=Candidatus Doolittlea endobia TaxID=1778262 RepID=A0A143WSB8_9ENTR|nr:hypothetical protein MHIR_DE00054 [Candidatus Doolittlea endobia]